mmetsp:Transcript_8022/g.14710  ORF Transcript_8022/g.14710 Transcript_8022/m.14710 type:complete len:203 (-) Transcript_8022:510-1118(-)
MKRLASSCPFSRFDSRIVFVANSKELENSSYNWKSGLISRKIVPISSKSLVSRLTSSLSLRARMNCISDKKTNIEARLDGSTFSTIGERGPPVLKSCSSGATWMYCNVFRLFWYVTSVSRISKEIRVLSSKMGSFFSKRRESVRSTEATFLPVDETQSLHTLTLFIVDSTPPVTLALSTDDTFLRCLFFEHSLHMIKPHILQ